MHHYTNFMDIGGFDEALDNCTNVIKLYEDLERDNYAVDEGNGAKQIKSDSSEASEAKQAKNLNIWEARSRQDLGKSRFS